MPKIQCTILIKLVFAAATNRQELFVGIRKITICIKASKICLALKLETKTLIKYRKLKPLGVFQYENPKCFKDYAMFNFQVIQRFILQLSSEPSTPTTVVYTIRGTHVPYNDIIIYLFIPQCFSLQICLCKYSVYVKMLMLS